MTKNRKLVYLGLAIWFGAIVPALAAEGIKKLFPRSTVCPSPFSLDLNREQGEMKTLLGSVQDWIFVESRRVLPNTIGLGFALGLIPVLLGALVKPIPATKPISWRLLFSAAFVMFMIPVFAALFDVLVLNRQ